ncbi:MAG: TonB-dependent receptor, partial [Bacteroidota bacterium]
MMTRFIISTLLTFIGFTLLAQTGKISGNILSAEGPLPFTNVILKNAADSSIAKAEITDEQGAYVFSSIVFGQYFMETSFVGMQDYRSAVFELNQSSFRIQPIILEDASTELGEVTVTAKRPMIEVLADKTVFNVENTLSSTGTDAFELLRKAPGVIIDNNDNLILEGKTGVQIYINNKLSPLTGEDLSNYLRSLQASDITAIEIITQPSSKYDAAGNAGIINIRLKKDKRLGTNGTLAAGVANGRNTRYNSSISFNNRTQQGNLFGTYSNNMGDTWSFIYLDRIQQGVRYDSETETLRDQNTNNVKVGYDFFPNSKHTFGVLFNGNFYNSEVSGVTNTPIIPLAAGEAEQILIANNESSNENYNILANANYRFADTSGHELLVDVDYGRYNRERISFQPNNYIDAITTATIFERNFRMNTPIDIDIFTAKADYSQPLFGGTFGIGAKYSTVRTNNIFQFYDVLENQDILNENRSN